MERFEEILKFLDCAIRTTDEFVKSKQGLDEKQIYYEHKKNLQNARHTLMKEIFTFEDYLKTGKYEVPEIKFTTITIPVKTVR